MKIALFAALVCLAAASRHQVLNLNNPDRILGEFLVVLHPPAAAKTNFKYASTVASRIAAISPSITIVNSFTNLKAPILHVKTSDESVMSQLLQIDEVKIVESNIYQTMVKQCSSQSTTDHIWGLSRISSRDTPNYSSAVYSYRSNGGNGIRVYFLDTGIRLTHNDFAGRGEFGVNTAGGGDEDINGHGTHVAGITAGTEFGVSKGATVIVVKVFNDFAGGTVSTIIAGVDWMVGDVLNRGVRGVGNMALGLKSHAALDSAVNSAYDANIPVVAAAGNANEDACDHSPARASGAITVASTDSSDVLSTFSNWGTCVDILAPGNNILSASHFGDAESQALTGTSMACAHVTGAVANYLSDNPDAPVSEVKSYLARTSTRDMIDLRGVSGTVNNLLYSSCA